MNINIIIILFTLISTCITHSATDLSELDTTWTAQTVQILQKIQLSRTRSREEVEDCSLKGPYHTFFGKGYVTHSEAHGIRYDQIIHHRQLALAASIKTLSTPHDHLKPSDPTKTHWHLVWITNPDTPHTMPYLKTIADNIKLHQGLYTFHVWSNTALESEQLELHETGAIFQYHLIKDISRHMHDSIVELLNRLIQARYYTFAADILRSALVYYHGNSDDEFNLYTDLGFSFYKVLDPQLLKNFNQVIGLMEQTSYSPCFLDMNSAFLAGYRGAQFAGFFFEELKQSLQNQDLSFFEIESKLTLPYAPFFSIPLVMNAFSQLNDEESRKTLYLPVTHTELVKWSHMRSWAKGDTGQTNFERVPVMPNTFFGPKVHSFTKDWIPPYPADVWEEVSGALKDIPHLKALEVGSWEGRDTLQIIKHLLPIPDATLEVVDWWKPYQAAFNAGGGYHRFLNNTEKAFDDRKLIITRGHPRFILPPLKQKVASGEKAPYHFIHLRFLHTKKQGYAATLQDAFSLLCSGGLLLTPCNAWTQGGHTHLQDVPAAFLSENRQNFDVVGEGDYLCLKKK